MALADPKRTAQATSKQASGNLSLKLFQEIEN